MTAVLQVACSLDISTTLHFMAQKYATVGAMLLVVKFLAEMLLGGDKPMNLVEKSMLFMAGAAFLGWQYVRSNQPICSTKVVFGSRTQGG